MKIAFVTIGDAHDVRRGSGTPYYLSRELERQGHQVIYAGPLNVTPPFLTRFFKYISRRMGRSYRSYRDPFMGKLLGQAAARLLLRLDYDLMLTNDYCLAGYTKTPHPIVLYTDDTFPHDFSKNAHPWFEDLSPFGVLFCQWTVKQGLQNASAGIFASQFAADEAQKYTANKYAVIPYGANIDAPKSIQREKIKGRVNLLFIGKYWELKNGNFAVEITQTLNLQGVNVHLHVVGVDLSEEYPQKFLTFYGLLNKNIPAEQSTLNELYKHCDILLVPSKAEGYGLVFVEAAAYGMPSLAYATSGVLTAVQNGVNGVLFPLSAGKDVFVNQIQAWMRSPEAYHAISKSARNYYTKTANWESAVKKLTTKIERILRA